MTKKYVPSLAEAEASAQSAANYLNTSVHLIYVHGEGYCARTPAFDLDRNYFHAVDGKKMFFDLVKTIKPNIY